MKCKDLLECLANYPFLIFAYINYYLSQSTYQSLITSARKLENIYIMYSSFYFELYFEDFIVDVIRYSQM